MGTNFSGEEFSVKTRKPYTITKQRERWTEEEHNKFLEALKLYGRDWQRIEEHIGTKTAVQIRSHAQKFFTKLEKESLTKGVLPGHVLDIDIPPPRPKKKPSNPYPRKTSMGAPTLTGGKDLKSATSVSSVCRSKQELDLENEPFPEVPSETEMIERTEGISEIGNHYVLDNFRKSGDLISTSSVPDVSAKQCNAREFVPQLNEMNDPTTTYDSFITIESKENQELHKSNIGDKADDVSRYERQDVECYVNTKLGGDRKNEVMQPDKLNEFSAERTSPPRHHFVNATRFSSSSDTDPVSMSHLSENQGSQTSFAIPIPPVTPTANQLYDDSGRPTFHPWFPFLHHPFNLFCSNQDSHRAFLNMSSTFSSLIISTLLQNPSIHAAATMAASFWPYAESNSTDNILGGCPIRQAGQSPSVTAIVAATIAAASAWWSLHGLLPFLPTPHKNCPFPPAAAEFPMTGTKQSTEDRRDDIASLSPSSGTEQNGCETSLSAEDKASSHGNLPLTCPALGMLDADARKAQKMLDRSSCGSNTTSSSDIETDRLEKHAGTNEEHKEPADLSSRRNKNMGSNLDSRKEVSEEGRLAFQALFSREILPQSFSPPCLSKNKSHPKNRDEEKKNPNDDFRMSQAEALKETQKSSLNSPQFPDYGSLENHSGERGQQKVILSRHCKLKGCRTGFKPYKRCSMEANERIVANSSCPNEEKVTKRLRMEGETFNASR